MTFKKQKVILFKKYVEAEKGSPRMKARMWC